MDLETDRLTPRPWAEGDADDYRALIAERDDGVVSVETTREGAPSARAGKARVPP
jgi:hypothetical protein